MLRLLSRWRRARHEDRDAQVIEARLGVPYAELPPTLPQRAEVDRAVEALRDALGIGEGLDVAISHNDLMFLHALHHHELTDAYASYLRTGHAGCRLVSRIAEGAFGGLHAVDSLLDFASGYGRLTRFLVLEIPPERIWVSDVKAQAVSFQVERFGVHGLVSSYRPARFRPDRRFDLIFVGSLFSHLPERLFRRWLHVLMGLLSDRGVLAFSVHDASLRGDGASDPFRFRKRSEDRYFAFVEDRIRRRSDYGTSHVSESFVAPLLDALRPAWWERLPHAFGAQDVYVAGRAPPLGQPGSS